MKWCISKWYRGLLQSKCEKQFLCLKFMLLFDPEKTLVISEHVTQPFLAWLTNLRSSNIEAVTEFSLGFSVVVLQQLHHYLHSLYHQLSCGIQPAQPSLYGSTQTLHYCKYNMYNPSLAHQTSLINWPLKHTSATPTKYFDNLIKVYTCITNCKNSGKSTEQWYNKTINVLSSITESSLPFLR